MRIRRLLTGGAQLEYFLSEIIVINKAFLVERNEQRYGDKGNTTQAIIYNS